MGKLCWVLIFFQNSEQKCNDTSELNVECYWLYRIFMKRVALGNKWRRDISKSIPILCKYKIHANQNLKSFICTYLYFIPHNSHESNNEMIAFILHANFKKYITTSNHYFKSPSLVETHKSHCIHEHFFFFVVFCTEARSNCTDNHKGWHYFFS